MNIQEKIRNIPDKPGVYLMKNADDSILYIGKAKNLKKRVSSYFHKKALEAKTEALLMRIRCIETFITDNEVEAMILESNLIKKYKPKFNIELKENNSYPYIKITRETFPRLVKTRIQTDDSAFYFGPYTNVKYINRTIKTITDIFPIRRCSINLDRKKSATPCLNYYLKKCVCPCCRYTDSDSYNDIVNQVIYFLKGQNNRLLQHIKQEMEIEARNQRFEQAILLRERYQALKHLLAEQKITTFRNENEDIVGIACSGDTHTITVLLKRAGKIIGKRDFTVRKGNSREDIIKQFITLSYEKGSDLPDRILLPEEIDGVGILQDYFKKKYNKSIQISVPRRGIRKRLIELASKNALQKSKEAAHLPDMAGVLEKLRCILHLRNKPRCIEAFDIATTLGTYSVAAMVRFADGIPDKKNYRKFRIRYTEGQNDVEMMKEAAARRYQRLLNENKPLPDLILVDGGRLQVDGVREILDGLSLSGIQVIGLAKKNEDIYTSWISEPLSLTRENDALRFLMAMRDEAHRFANTYHVDLRGKNALTSSLKNVPGIGEGLTTAILSILETSELPITLETLASIKGIGPQKAGRVYTVLQKTSSIPTP